MFTATLNNSCKKCKIIQKKLFSWEINSIYTFDILFLRKSSIVDVSKSKLAMTYCYCNNIYLLAALSTTWI